MLLTLSRAAGASLWKSGPKLFSKFHKCVQNSYGFAQRSLYFLHFWNETKKKGIKEGFFGASKTWVLFSSKNAALRPSIIRL